LAKDYDSGLDPISNNKLITFDNECHYHQKQHQNHSVDFGLFGSFGTFVQTSPRRCARSTRDVIRLYTVRR